MLLLMSADFLFLINFFKTLSECQTGLGPGPEVIKLFSCPIQLSMKFQLLIKTKISTNEEVSL